MKKFVILSFACIVSALMLFGCGREQTVQAGSEQSNTGTYQPRPATRPKDEVQQNQAMSGELRHVDMAAKTFSIRVDNGMEQTFKFDDDTTVTGLEVQPLKTGHVSIRDLMGKEGSEVTVQWRETNGTKTATHVDVTQISAALSRTHTGKAKTKTAY